MKTRTQKLVDKANRLSDQQKKFRMYILTVYSLQKSDYEGLLCHMADAVEGTDKKLNDFWGISFKDLRRIRRLEFEDKAIKMPTEKEKRRTIAKKAREITLEKLKSARNHLGFALDCLQDTELYDVQILISRFTKLGMISKLKKIHKQISYVCDLESGLLKREVI